MGVRPSLLRAFIALLVLIAGGEKWARAQHNPFYDSELALTDQDLQPLEAAAAKLFNMDQPKIGSVETWNNPATGVRGTVTLTRAEQRNGLPCRTLRYVILNPRLARPTDVALNWCRTEAGEWKIAA